MAKLATYSNLWTINRGLWNNDSYSSCSEIWQFYGKVQQCDKIDRSMNRETERNGTETFVLSWQRNVRGLVFVTSRFVLLKRQNHSRMNCDQQQPAQQNFSQQIFRTTKLHFCVSNFTQWNICHRFRDLEYHRLLIQVDCTSPEATEMKSQCCRSDGVWAPCDATELIWFVLNIWVNVYCLHCRIWRTQA